MSAEPDDEEDWAVSEHINSLPAFLTVAGLLDETSDRVIKAFFGAERPSPPKYDAARQLIIKGLSGRASHEWLLAQARSVPEKGGRRQAVDVVKPAAGYLATAQPGVMSELRDLCVTLRPGVDLPVKPVWLRACEPETVVVFHFWEQPLSLHQKRLAATLLKMALAVTRYRHAPLEFVSVSQSALDMSRRCVVSGWNDLPPLVGTEYEAFVARLLRAWDDYQSRPPRPYKRRRPKGLL